MKRARFVAQARREILAEVSYYSSKKLGLGRLFLAAVEDGTARALAYPPPHGGIHPQVRIHINAIPPDEERRAALIQINRFGIRGVWLVGGPDPIHRIGRRQQRTGLRQLEHQVLPLPWRHAGEGRQVEAVFIGGVEHPVPIGVKARRKAGSSPPQSPRSGELEACWLT